MDELQTISDVAEGILADDSDPVVRYRLLRDVLCRPAGDRELAAARRTLDGSRWVQLLAAEQHADGSWGRFHSVNTRAGQKIGTTEIGMARAVELGLGPEHPILRKAADYIIGILKGEVRFPDPAERNDRWPAGAEMFAGATLALIHPNLSVLDSPWQRWADILSRVFADGEFSADAEIEAHGDLHGIRDGVGYLGLRNRYAVGLLGSRADRLSAAIEESYLGWLWSLPNGLGYIDVPLCTPSRPRRIPGWLHSLSHVAVFPSWRQFGLGWADWLLGQRNRAGLWDFGPKASRPRFSESWRKPARRAHDHSLSALILLRQYFQGG
ncbi:hypothetical protein LCGC14_1668850 [marine sediment metagenome]|uniref:Squalene cyclase C-terminal domain-containing protein n=1 Tax=marine sediment metagenome TaxID=412755 RepID=A0A0F9HRW7_9ZZZZ